MGVKIGGWREKKRGGIMICSSESISTSDPSLGLTTIILLCTIPAIKYRLRCHYHSHPPDSVPLPPSPNHPLNVSHMSRYQDERKQKDSIIPPPNLLTKTQPLPHKPQNPHHPFSLLFSFCSSFSALSLVFRSLSTHISLHPSTFSPFSPLPPKIPGFILPKYQASCSQTPPSLSVKLPPLFSFSLLSSGPSQTHRPSPFLPLPLFPPLPEKPFHPLKASPAQSPHPETHTSPFHTQ